MQTIYITTPGASIHRRGDVLQVRKAGAVYHTIFPFRTEQVVVFGGVEISRCALDFLLYHGISTVFLSKNGRYNGQLVPPFGKNVLLRRRQYRMHDDDAFGLRFARNIVHAKIRNQAVIVGRIRRFQNRDVGRVSEELSDLAEGARTAGGLDQLRGYEGRAARLYFSVLDKGFAETQGFRRRIRRPPTDPVNAALSLLYTILFHRVDNVVERHGLDPYFGHFHSLYYGRRSLALDLMEEYRPVVVDTLVFSLFNLGVISRSDFSEVVSETPPADEDSVGMESAGELEEGTPPAGANAPDVTRDRMGAFSEHTVDVPSDYEPPGEKTSLEEDGHIGGPRRAVLFSKEGLGRALEQFERKLDTEFRYELTGETVTYRRVFDEQVRQYIRALTGEADEYTPLVMR